MMEKVDEALALSESYVEKYLPDSEDEGEIKENGKENDLSPAKMKLTKMRYATSKDPDQHVHPCSLFRSYPFH